MLIAGTPLEPYKLQRRHEIWSSVNVLKIIRIWRSAGKPRIEESSTTIPIWGVGLQAIGNPKSID